MKKKLVIFIVALFSITLAINLCQSALAKADKEKAKMSTISEEADRYLYSLYGEEFVITNVKYIEGLGSYRITVYPKSNPKLVFGITQFNGELQGGVSYLNRVWNQSATMELEKKLNPIYPKAFNASVVVSGQQQDFLTAIPGCYEKNLSKAYELDTSKFKRRIEIIIFKNITDANKDEELANLFKILAVYKDKGLYEMKVKYFPENFKQKVNLVDTSSLIYEADRTYGFEISEKELSSLKEIRDINKYLKRNQH